MRYTYLGDILTDPALIGLQCDPVRRADGKCVVARLRRSEPLEGIETIRLRAGKARCGMGTALVEDAQGVRYVVIRRRLRLNSEEGESR